MSLPAGTRIAFVTPWYGTGKGGAEVFCGGLARAVAALGHEVEILTTCCSDAFLDWGRDDRPAGTEKDGAVTVRRFPVRPRNADTFAHFWRVLDAGVELAEAQQEEMLANGINSDALCAHIAATRDSVYHFFLPYLYGTTYHGVRAAGPRSAFLIPCLHNEPVAYMSVLQDMFRRTRGCLFLAEPERDLATALYDISRKRLMLLGGGVDRDTAGDPGRWREHAPFDGPFALFAGRKVPGKGADLLLDHFARYLAARPDCTLRLVLLGGGSLEIPDALRGRAFSLDAPNQTDVFDAMAACEFLIHPSFYESFSLVVMEAWLNGRPVLVNGECEVTRHHVLQSGGGLWFSDFGEFCEAVDLLSANAMLRRQLADAGRRHVEQNYLWHDVAMRFHNFVAEVEAEDRHRVEGP